MINNIINYYLNHLLIINVIGSITLIIIGIICYLLRKQIIIIYQKNKEIINYIIAGVMTTIVSVGSYYLLRIIANNYLFNTVLSWILAVLFAFVINKKYVFESKDNNILKEMSMFFSSRIITLLIEISTMFLLVDMLKTNDMIAKILVQFIIMILNYILSKFIVFKKGDKK